MVQKAGLPPGFQNFVPQHPGLLDIVATGGIIEQAMELLCLTLVGIRFLLWLGVSGCSVRF